MRGSFARNAVVVAALLVGALPGCVQPKHPKLHVTHASFTGVDLSVRPLSVRLHLELTVLAENPNSFDLKATRVKGTTTIAEKHEVPVELHPDAGVRANASSTFAVPIAIPAEMIPSLAKEALLHPCIPYKFEGTVDLVATSTFELERRDYPLKKEGCLAREKLLAVIKP